jgi:outer membrane protein TolC
MTLDECVHRALQNSKVLSKLGGVVVNAPAGAATLLDQAIIETDPFNSVEAALTAFDAQFNSSIGLGHSERTFNNAFFGGGAASNITNTGNFRAELSKQTAAGTIFSVRNITDYNRNNSPFNQVPSVWDTVNQVDIRQPLLRGSGVAINRIAGPNATPGRYNGVLISRVRSDISLADFEATVRDLVRDVERNYWELYFAYRDLDTKMTARDATRKTWENRKLRLDNGVGRPDEEAQARQQYFNFKAQAENALTGVGAGQLGVLGAERNLRRLMGLSVGDNTIIKPTSEPSVAPIAFDWQASQAATLEQRPEIRRQKWTIKQRELEYAAAKALNTWQLDLVGQYGFRGFGDNLFGSRSRSNGSAFDDLINGDLDDWNFGFELNGPIGNRQGHLAIRNAELRLMREKAVLREQQRQLLHDLSAAYTEVDRAMTNIRTTYNTRLAIQEELEPKRIRAEEGKDQIFFLLDVQQRAASLESQLIRSIITYNQALLDYAYTTGGLLARYNIHLQEDEWTTEAQQNAIEKAVRYRTLTTRACTDLGPLSAGLDSQQAIPVSYSPNFATGESYSTQELMEVPQIDGQIDSGNPDVETDLPKIPSQDEG